MQYVILMIDNKEIHQGDFMGIGDMGIFVCWYRPAGSCFSEMVSENDEG